MRDVRAYYGRMRRQEINRISSYAVVFLSLVALLAVLSGYTQPPQKDEGTGAHIFQLSIVVLAPMMVLFLATSDWKQPLSMARPLAFSLAALVLAFGALYYLEHYRDPNYVGRSAPPGAWKSTQS
jgi:hypothetical protein